MNADVAVVQGFGMTESSPTTHLLPMADAANKTGSIGVLLSNLEARLVDEGVDTEEGKPGELWIKGPTIMKVRCYLISFVDFHVNLLRSGIPQ